MAVGVAHPSVEAWLLADASAIQRGLNLERPPEVPEAPEAMPETTRTRGQEAKHVLRQCAARIRPLSAKEMKAVAEAINEHGLVLLRERCPLGFAPFADEVEQRIRPLFGSHPSEEVS